MIQANSNKIDYSHHQYSSNYTSSLDINFQQKKNHKIINWIDDGLHLLTDRLSKRKKEKEKKIPKPDNWIRLIHVILSEDEWMDEYSRLGWFLSFPFFWCDIGDDLNNDDEDNTMMDGKVIIIIIIMSSGNQTNITILWC